MATIRQRLTRPFMVLEIVGLSAGVMLSFLGWKEMKTIQYIREVAWPVADAAMEMRISRLQEEVSLVRAHWEGRLELANIDSLRDLHRQLIAVLQKMGGAGEGNGRRLVELENQYHEQVDAMWRDLAAGADEEGATAEHRPLMAALDSTSLEMDSLLTAIEADADEAMDHLNRQASVYSYIGMGTMLLLGVAMLGLTKIFEHRIQRYIVAPVEEMSAEVSAGEVGGFGEGLTVPQVAELGLLARAMNQFLKRMEEDQAERQQMDRLLVQTERMASVGIAVSGIVHNLRNPLTAISGFTDLLRRRHPELEELDQVRGAVGQMKQMIANLLDRERTTGKKEAVDLNALLLRELDFLQADLTFKHEVERQVRLGENLPSLEGVYADLSQIFGNLLRNAVDAMHGRKVKRLTLVTSCDGDHLIVEVADTGCGISREKLPHLFEPFFTTKAGDAESGGVVGTGLGLYTVELLLESYGGTVEVESIEKVGTTFRVKIPLAGDAG